MNADETKHWKNDDQKNAGPTLWLSSAALMLAFILAGCVDDGGTPRGLVMMEILGPEEVPDGHQDCEFSEELFSEEEMQDPDWEEEDQDEYEYPDPEEYGLQFLAPGGSPCEDADYVVFLSWARYSSADFNEVEKQYDEMYNGDDEWGGEWGGDYGCSYGVFLWGDDQEVTASAMDPAVFEDDYDFMNAEPLTGHEDAMEQIADSLKSKYPSLEASC